MYYFNAGRKPISRNGRFPNILVRQIEPRFFYFRSSLWYSVVASLDMVDYATLEAILDEKDGIESSVCQNY